MPKVLVGLGNPGARYDKTRHNIGFDAVDRFVSLHGGGAGFKASNKALVAELRWRGELVVVVKPTTFMNASGEAVGPIAAFYKVDLADIVVVHDDLDLPLGALRVRLGGGDGGHNGIRSIAAVVGSRDFARVKLGIGRPPARESVPKEVLITDWVLGVFDAAEAVVVGEVVERCVQAVADIFDNGVKSAQQRFNQVGSEAAATKAG